MKKPERLQALIKSYEYLVENNFMIPKGIGIGNGGYPKERVLPQDKEKITTGMYAEKRPMMLSGTDKFVILEGEYLPTGEQLNAAREAIDLLYQIKALREELGIEGTPLKRETEILSEIEKAKTEARRFDSDYGVSKLISAFKEANTRTVDVSEIKEVAEGERIESKNGAINAVTSPEEEKNKEGQSHNDE